MIAFTKYPARAYLLSEVRRAVVSRVQRGWVNAKGFAVLAFRPDLKDHPVYRASVAGFAAWGFTGRAAVAWQGWLGQR